MVFGPADAGAGASAVPLFASLPLAEPENESVPLPETSYCQVNVADAPPASSVPAGEAGADATVAAALPVVETTGEGSAFRRTAAPPPLLSASANDSRCSPAEVIAGVAEAVREGVAGRRGGRGNESGRRAPRDCDRGQRQRVEDDRCATGVRRRKRYRDLLEPGGNLRRAGRDGERERSRGLHRHRSGRSRRRRNGVGAVAVASRRRCGEADGPHAA